MARRGEGGALSDAGRDCHLLRIQRDVAVELSRATRAEEAAGVVVDALLRIEPRDSAGLYAARPDGGFVLSASRGFRDGFLADVSEIPPGDPRAAFARAGRSYFGPPGCEGGAPCPTAAAEGLRWVGIVPVLRDGRAIACVNAASHGSEPASDRAVEAVRSIATIACGALARIGAEEASHAKEQNLEHLFDSLRDFLFVLDDAGRIESVNAVVERKLGYGREELVGRHVLEVHPPDRREEAGAIVLAMLEGTCDSCPVPLLAKDGSIVPVETVVTRGTWGGRPALVGVSRDLTAVHRAEAALRERESHYRQVVDALSEG